MKDLFEYLMSWVLIGAFYIIIYISWGCETIKMWYYTIFGIPYIKQSDKFHPYYMRIK